LADLCDPLIDLNWRIDSAIEKFTNKFSTNDQDVFIAGHSLGAVGASYYYQYKISRNFAGLIV
jgi:alpha-beta hydrolase superfamily lysophospholipase